MNPVLSICIPTLNRARFISETLDSILAQDCREIEIVIVDGGSKDDTKKIVDKYVARYINVRYLLSPYNELSSGASNAGFDRDCDHAVRSANGQYCWLMTDDDILASNSIAKILMYINQAYDVMVTSIAVKDLHLDKTLLAKRPAIERDLVFYAEQWNDFFVNSVNAMSFVGCVIVKRTVWIKQNTESYFGSGFIHIGVIFNRPLLNPNLLICEPLVVVRYSNALWTKRAFQITMINWPQLIWSFSGLTNLSKTAVIDYQPWHQTKNLLRLRAMNAYNNSVYIQQLGATKMSLLTKAKMRMFASMPRVLARACIYLAAWKLHFFNSNSLLLQDLRDSR